MYFDHNECFFNPLSAAKQQFKQQNPSSYTAVGQKCKASEYRQIGFRSLMTPVRDTWLLSAEFFQAAIALYHMESLMCKVARCSFNGSGWKHNDVAGGGMNTSDQSRGAAKNRKLMLSDFRYFPVSYLYTHTRRQQTGSNHFN